jgi:protein involved in sex pheromone biosynthesis
VGFIQMLMGCWMEVNIPLKYFGKLSVTAVHRFVAE